MRLSVPGIARPYAPIIDTIELTQLLPGQSRRWKNCCFLFCAPWITYDTWQQGGCPISKTILSSLIWQNPDLRAPSAGFRSHDGICYKGAVFFLSGSRGGTPRNCCRRSVKCLPSRFRILLCFNWAIQGLASFAIVDHGSKIPSQHNSMSAPLGQSLLGPWAYSGRVMWVRLTHSWLPQLIRKGSLGSVDRRAKASSSTNKAASSRFTYVGDEDSGVMYRKASDSEDSPRQSTWSSPSKGSVPASVLRARLASTASSSSTDGKKPKARSCKNSFQLSTTPFTSSSVLRNRVSDSAVCSARADAFASGAALADAFASGSSPKDSLSRACTRRSFCSWLSSWKRCSEQSWCF